MPNSKPPRLEQTDGSSLELVAAQLPLIIGRAPQCELTVNDYSISRRHAQITENNGSFYIEDLGSRNGTTVNNNRLFKRTELKDRDRIQICESTFTFRHPQSKMDSDPVSLMYDEQGNGLSSILSRMEVGTASSATALEVDRKLETLMHITRTLNRTLRLDETLQNVMDYLFELFSSADRGVIVLTGPDGEAKPLATKVRESVQDPQIRVSNSILKYVMGNRQSVLSHDVVSDERIDTGHSLEQFPIRSVMSVPLINSEDEAIGMIQLDTTHRQRAFNQEDLELLTNVAIQSGMAIENSRLVEQLLESKLLTRELETARRVQENLLPQQEPKVEGYSFHHFYRPMSQIGGDYFDYLHLEDGRIAIIVGDVVGHGIPAALLMAKLASECRMALQSRDSLGTLAGRLNESFTRLEPDKYATLIMTILDPVRHRLEVMNGGHLPPIVRRASGKGEELSPVNNFAIGVFSEEDIGGDLEFETFEIDLRPGDSVLLHTDGLNECMNEADQEYSRERVLEQFSCADCTTPQAAVDRLITDVGQHAGNVSQHDDICLVSFQREG